MMSQNASVMDFACFRDLKEDGKVSSVPSYFFVGREPDPRMNWNRFQAANCNWDNDTPVWPLQNYSHIPDILICQLPWRSHTPIPLEIHLQKNTYFFTRCMQAAYLQAPYLSRSTGCHTASTVAVEPERQNPFTHRTMGGLRLKWKECDGNHTQGHSTFATLELKPTTIRVKFSFLFVSLLSTEPFFILKDFPVRLRF